MNLLGPSRVDKLLDDIKVLESEREVAMTLEHIITTVVREKERAYVLSLNRECTHWNSNHANAQADLMVLEPQLLNETLQAKSKTDRLKTENGVIGKKLERLKIQVGSLIEEENRLLSREDEMKAKKDVSVLPIHVLRRVVYFFTRADFFNVLTVCRRWRYNFDKAYLWKVFVVRLEMASLVAGKKRKTELERSMVPPPEQFRIQCGNSKRGLQKSEIFLACLQEQETEVVSLESLKEDIEGKIRAKANVEEFLQKELDKVQHELGLMRVQRHQWESKAFESSICNKTVAKSLASSDMALKEELNKKQLIMESSARQLSEISTKINILKEIQEVGASVEGAPGLSSIVARKKQEKKQMKVRVLSLRDTLQHLVIETSKLKKISKIYAGNGSVDSSRASRSSIGRSKSEFGSKDKT
ncbi:hypothetical protein AAMO2058_001676700 [Amorphochlora amoebiformis]